MTLSTAHTTLNHVASGIMTPELKTKWLTAMRDGSHKHGKHAYRNDLNNGEGTPDYRHCALGVLLDVADKGMDASELYEKSLLESFQNKIKLRFLDRNGISIDAYDLISMLNDTHTNYEAAATWIEESL